MAERHVYILDDDPEIVTLIRRTCMALGIPASTFASVEEFKGVAGFPAGSIILLDLGLGEHNGVDILRLLAGGRCQAAIYIVSGADERLLGTVQKLGQSYGLDVRGVLPKPFRIADLKAVLETAGEPQPTSRKRVSQEEELHRAILAGELVLHYQPKIDLRSGAVIAAEALVRWQHPQRGMIPPGQFLPLAEETGLIGALTDWVLNEALRQMAEWQSRGLSLKICVNMPAEMLKELSLPSMIARLLKQHGVVGSNLIFEITETGVMRDLVTATDVLARLRLIGLSLAIDDFGTGHSSMLKLRQLPFNEIKIDQSFVREITASADDKALVATMIGMGQGLGMTIIAEGVETEAALTVLRELGCDMAQGYHISRPIPADELFAWVSERVPPPKASSLRERRA